MIIHSLKVAWRNLLKYKTQSVISIMGLAIGFTAFSFTLSWIRYERGYDKHIPDADRIFKVLEINERAEGGVQFSVPVAMKAYLENLPEVEAVTAVHITRGTYKKIDIALMNDANIMLADSSFFTVFYPGAGIHYPAELPENPVILSEKAAREMGISRSDIGRHIDSHGFTLLNIVPGLPDRQTNVPFDVMTVRPLESGMMYPWRSYSRPIYLRIRENANMETLAAKLDSIYIDENRHDVKSYMLVPLRETRYLYPEDEANIRYRHLRMFAGVSALVIVCALFNFLMLFISKIKLRSRELALRKASGASNPKLVILLLVEVGLILLSSLFLSAVLVESLYSWFIKLSGIEASKFFLLKGMIGYGMAIFCLSLLGALLPVSLFVGKNVSGVIKNGFTMGTLFIQLIVSVWLIFCTFLFLYQFKMLNAKDIGFNRFNINSIITNTSLTKDEILKIAGVEEVVFFQEQFLPRGRKAYTEYKRETGEIIETESIQIHEPDFIPFFGIKILEGRNFHYGEINACLINETAKRRFGFTDAVGERVNGLTVIGVISDMYVDTPSIPVFPSIYTLQEKMEIYTLYSEKTGQWEYHGRPSPSSGKESFSTSFNIFAYEYLPGHRESTERAITKLITDNGGSEFHFNNMEEVYDGYTRSENYLLVLLSIMTVVAILIAVFGIYSMITLSCNQRRKEIAIRKVNGAKAREIFMLFFKQYFMVTVVSCIVAFPIGVYIMQRWLEQYARRVSMEWWLFVGIFILVLLIVIASIFSRVSRAAKENPVEMLKSE